MLFHFARFPIQAAHIHCPTKGPNIMKRKENRINMEKLAVMEFEILSETDSFFVNLYMRE